MTEIDFIGDVHGHADVLETVLSGLGYRLGNGSWRHSDRGRRAVFLGDLIDRGPDQLRAVDIARRMRDAGDADVMLGNHEHNAIGWAMRHPATGKPLRVHGSKNRSQHAAFLAAAQEDSAIHRELISWMRGLPFYVDLGEAKACHACWHEPSVAMLAQASVDGQPGVLPAEAMVETFDKSSPLNDAQEKVLKGLEADLPEGFSFADKDGIVRHRSRLRWWDVSSTTFATGAIREEGLELPDIELPDGSKAGPSGGEPVFFGHYWMKGLPVLMGPHHACLDFSVARDGNLCAYTWRGERELLPENLSWAGPGSEFNAGLPERVLTP